MHGDMIDIYAPRNNIKQFQVFEKRLRHIPVKRIAPYPDPSSVIALPKRSKVAVHSPLPKGKALSLRPVNICIRSQANCTRGGPLRGANQHMAGNTMNGMIAPGQYSALQQSLPSDQMRFVTNGHQQSCGYLPPNCNDKLGCCPLRQSTARYSTPPYCARPSDTGRAGPRRVPRNPKLKGLKGKKNAGNVNNPMTSDVGLLESVKTEAPTTIKVQSNCMKYDDQVIRENAMSFVDCKSSTKIFEGPTASTALVSRSSGSVKTTGSSQGYSNNFNPQMTSTPQRPRDSSGSTESSSQFKKPYPPKTSYGDDMSVLLSILDEERKAGKLKMSPLEHLAAVAENSLSASNGTTTSYSNYSLNISNNNNSIYYGIRKYKNKQTPIYYKLPTMPAIGAPKAASSPIVNTTITGKSAGKFAQCQRLQHHHAGNKIFGPPITASVGLWRPW